MGDRCCMCLSGSRRRAAVTARHLQHMLLIYLDLKVVTSVCWECEARLSRLNGFRLQVEKAQRVLQQLPDPHSLQSVRSLSSLASHHKNKFDVCFVEGDEACKEEMSPNVKIHNDEIKLENNDESADDENESKMDVLNYEDDDNNIDNDDDDWDDNHDDKSYGDDTKLDAKGSGADGHMDLGNSYRTTKLSKAELKAQRELLRADANFSSAAYKCKTCIKTFHTQDKLDYHIEKFHDREGCACRVCRQRFDSKALLSSHTRQHYCKYECNLCQYTTTHYNYILRHYSRKHKNYHPCNQCHKKFESHNLLAQHKVHIHEDKKECPRCGRDVPRSQYYQHVRQHKKPKPKKKQMEQCPICKKSFLHLKVHLGMKLNDPEHGAAASLERPYCVECDRRFTSEALYQKHLATSAPHAAPRFECAHCGKKFTEKRTLRIHITGVHMRVTRLQCRYPDCQEVFSRREQLRAHLAARHAHDPPPKTLLCPHCGKAFSEKKTLTNHILTHTGERPHRCPECDRGFTQKHCLTTHLLKAHGIITKVEGAVVPDAKKRFRCPECAKSYVKSHNLRVHLYKHHGHPFYTDKLPYQKRRNLNR